MVLRTLPQSFPQWRCGNDCGNACGNDPFIPALLAFVMSVYRKMI